MGFPDNCKYCNETAEFAAMVEDDDPHKHHTEYVCANHLETLKSCLIECWTWAEWVNED